MSSCGHVSAVSSQDMHSKSQKACNSRNLRVPLAFIQTSGMTLRCVHTAYNLVKYHKPMNTMTFQVRQMQQNAIQLNNQICVSLKTH